ncbi:MAG: ribbon-helix-helix protein, CopG family [Candidatus Hydrogenedentes bacterium]|nr:ribbon-helix-helix protein, CopG family [Candidatus Hydrogenedentota bacterium]
MKTAISLPDPMFKKAERLAKRLGVSRSELYQQAIEALLERYDAKAITDSYNAVIARNPASFRIDASLERAQFENLPDDEW